LSGTRALDAAGTPVHLRLIYRDVTEERTLEAQLQRAQKLDAIGRLAGGVAHDFNNLLTVMQGITEALGQELQSPSARLELEDLRRAVQQATELTRSLLTFSRRTPVTVGQVDLNTVVARSQRLLERVLGKGVSLSAQLAPEACLVNADGDHLEQVVVNLVMNARDAMPQGGPIEVATRHLELRPGAPELHADQAPGRWVELSVTDRGTGIPLAVQPRVFEPFFSTKTAGRGTGLGLAMVYGVVKQAGGVVSFDTALGQGTTFRVLLPRSVEVPAQVPIAAASPSHATMLCVDDDATVLRVTARILRNAGYTVLEAQGGEAAVSLMRQRGAPVDLVVCDVVMPDLEGPTVVHLLSTEKLAARAIFVSGYTADLGSLQAPLVRKPFTASELLERVREVLSCPLSPSPLGRASG
jgi:nitrogen-specific signal transduction histidine kinase/CheY-like chemotaxis protein